MAKFAHIAPTKVIDYAAKRSGILMALYHLCDDDKYVTAMIEAKHRYGLEIILDNSFFELGVCPPDHELLDAALSIDADYVVMADGTTEGLELFKEQGLKVMYIPSGPNMDETFTWAMESDSIDLVGLSFIHAKAYVGAKDRNDPSTRFKFLQSMKGEYFHNKKIHILGMGHSVGEIALLAPFRDDIYSWDSSAAVWAGQSNKLLCNSAVKNPATVDFKDGRGFTAESGKNIDYVNSLVKLTLD